MIGVSSSNKSFRVLARYLSEGRTGEEQNRVAWVASRNLPTDDPELAARIMRATAGQNVRVKEPVYHLALSFDPGDAVDRAEPLSFGLRAALILPAIGTLFLGIFPGWVLDFAGKSSTLVR